MELSDYEYTVAQVHEGKWRVFKWLMLGGYLAFAGIYFAIACITRFIPIVAILPLFVWILVYFTYKYVNPEYNYKISEGNIQFFRVFGKKQKEILKTRIYDAKYIMPLENALEEIKEFAPKRTYSALPSMHTTDSYILLYCAEDGEHRAFMFKATSDALKSLRFYNKSTVMSQTEV